MADTTTIEALDHRFDRLAYALADYWVNGGADLAVNGERYARWLADREAFEAEAIEAIGREETLRRYVGTPFEHRPLYALANQYRAEIKPPRKRRARKAKG